MSRALAADLYELTMMAGYDHLQLDARATFDLYVRRLPANRAYLVAAGLEQALAWLENLRFTEDEITWLRTLPNLSAVPDRFFERTLPDLRFTGDVDAMPEGTPVFGSEPLLRVTAPLMEAQLVETGLLAIITFQTSIASKAARIVHAAAGRGVMEFGSRRAHGLDAALHAARAAYLAGCSSTSNVEAGYRFGIPLSGTMAHSWVTSFHDELEAFRRFAELYGEAAIFLIDTYDSRLAAQKIVSAGLRPAAVRLDSGDLGTIARDVRAILDAGGLSSTRIVASGDLDEWSIAELVRHEAPVDGFGVGTALSTSSDAPALGGIYKLVEIARANVPAPVMKMSGEKSSMPGRKQVWRSTAGGVAVHDTIGLDTEPAPRGARPLLEPVMRGGRRLGAPPALEEIRLAHARQLGELPKDLLEVETTAAYPVARSPALQILIERTTAALRPRIRP